MVEPIRVLIVDDQLRARKSVKALLSTWQRVGEIHEAGNDEDLRRVQTPTMLFVGGHSVIYNPNRALQRATRRA